MSKIVKNPAGEDAKRGPISKRGEVGKKIPGSKAPKMLEKSRGWDGKRN